MSAPDRVVFAAQIDCFDVRGMPAASKSGECQPILSFRIRNYPDTVVRARTSALNRVQVCAFAVFYCVLHQLGNKKKTRSTNQL